ncbi:MAG: Tfp pilus assembly protein FimT/FimU [Candidatus Berkiella sp.]
MSISVCIPKGFTLIEGIMVILLIVILSATATTMLTGHKIFTERFFTDELTQMVFYARKVAMATECEVEISNNQTALILLQREDCQDGEFTRHLPGVSVLENEKQYEVMIPKGIELKGQFPVYIDPKGKLYEKANKKSEKIAWRINNKIINIDPLSGFSYESH